MSTKRQALTDSVEAVVMFEPAPKGHAFNGLLRLASEMSHEADSEAEVCHSDMMIRHQFASLLAETSRDLVLEGL
eukprot:1295995-Heterocapsa_arctica.AAC.1